MTPLLSAIANHLWQSTVFACVAGLLTLLLRKNRARVRYAVWVAASFKFLIPFAVLIALGSLIHLRTGAVVPQSSAYVVMDDVSQPFTVSAVSFPVKPVPPVRNLIPTILIAIWAVGFIGISTSWLIRWWRIRRAVRAGSPLNLEIPIRVVSSSTVAEPGVFGTVRPVLFLPEGISERLTPDQLKAVISHELCHVRYRDNLIAAIQMFVETVFWFHPMVWWMGKRMVDERERACDEDVLRMGSDPGVYAEGILKVCRFYLESPVACVSGITGSDLKRRIQRIMMRSFGEALSARKKLLLATAGAVALAIPVIVGALNLRAQSGDKETAQSGPSAAERPSFDVTSVKVNKSVGGLALTRFQPGGLFTATNATVGSLITIAYQLKGHQLSEAPKSDPLLSEHFDIDAKAGGSPSREQMLLMLQSLLADRFKLVVHHETRQQPVYALALSKSGKTGPQITPHSDDANCIDITSGTPAPLPGPGQAMPALCGGFSNIGHLGTVQLSGNKITMDSFIAQLGNFVDRMVVDRTGLSGTFDLTLRFVRPELESQPAASSTSSDPLAPPSIFTAIEEQLGLKLESQMGPVDVLVIDHVEKPTDNAEVPAVAPAPAAGPAVAGVVMPSQSSSAQADRPAFEVTSVKPIAAGDRNFRFGFQPGGRFVSTTMLSTAISFAYDLPFNPSVRLTGSPDWIFSRDVRYDIEATGVFPDGLSEAARMDRERLMVQALLADRFKLVIHRETKEIPVYALVVAKGGPKLQKADIEEKDCPDRYATPAPDPKTLCHALLGGGGRGFYARAVSISELASGFENYTGDRPLVDKTGIQGLYHIETTPFLPMKVVPSFAPGAKAEDGTPLEDVPIIPEVFEKLGLKMEPESDNVDVYVIDHIEKPSEN